MTPLSPQDESRCVMTDAEQWDAMDSIAIWAIEHYAELKELDRLAAIEKEPK